MTTGGNKVVDETRGAITRVWELIARLGRFVFFAHLV